MFKSLRQNIGRSIINRKLRNHKREKNIYGFDEAKLIGVLFSVQNIGDFNLIKEFLVYLRNFNCNVVALCYIDSKKIPDYYLLKKGFNFFTRNNLSLFYIPKSPLIDDFINQKFDILLNLCLEELVPIEYVVNLSKAKFKIGRFQKNKYPYDLMIDVSKKNTIENLIDNIKYYIPLFASKEKIL